MKRVRWTAAVLAGVVALVAGACTTPPPTGGGTTTTAPPSGEPVAIANASPTSGTAPLTVQFDSAGSLPGTGSGLTFSWNFGDGSPTGSGASTSHVYETPGSYSATLTMTNSFGSSTAPPISITVNADPNPAFFVRSGGSSGTDCGPVADPCASIAEALANATDSGVGEVRVAGGNYDEPLVVPSDMRIVGGYNDSFTDFGAFTTISGSDSAPPVLFDGVTDAGISGVSIQGVTRTSGDASGIVVRGGSSSIDIGDLDTPRTFVGGGVGTNPSGILVEGGSFVDVRNTTSNSGTPVGSSMSAYGLRALESSVVNLVNSEFVAQPGTAGIDGAPAASDGSDGANGSNGGGASSSSGGSGGAGGSGENCGGSGGKGGRNNHGGAESGDGGCAPRGGAGGTPGNTGGRDGQPGAKGAAGSSGVAAGLPGTADTWLPLTGGTGGDGESGGGGGGGGGGKNQTQPGGGGGGGGAGGEHGVGGAGGTGAGGSFGVYASNATVNVLNSTATSSAGGVGGDGTDGSAGGRGGNGGSGGKGCQCAGTDGHGGGGAAGGAGGSGGGGGAGGAGGPSIAMFHIGTGAMNIGGGTSQFRPAVPAPGGAGGAGGAPGSGGGGGSGGEGPGTADDGRDASGGPTGNAGAAGQNGANGLLLRIWDNGVTTS